MPVKIALEMKKGNSRWDIASGKRKNWQAEFALRSKLFRRVEAEQVDLFVPVHQASQGSTNYPPILVVTLWFQQVVTMAETI